MSRQVVTKEILGNLRRGLIKIEAHPATAKWNSIRPGDIFIYTDGTETISKTVRQVIHQPNWKRIEINYGEWLYEPEGTPGTRPIGFRFMESE